jgi:protein-disulfide isomerase
VVIVVFTDFQCPFCKEEAQMLRQNLLSAYPKEVRLYFKDFPLSQIHQWAKTAAMAGRCIFRQNPASFWDYHDWVYANQADLTADNFKAKLIEFARSKDVDTIQLSRCLETRATEGEVDRSLAEGKALNIRSTPTLFLNGRRLEGQLPWPNLREIIDNEIEYQKTAKNAGEDCGCEVKLPSPLGN